jgi:hypothetical protein
MATTINADNGAVSGSAGLKYSSDSSGVLALQTNGTTAVTISTGQVATFAQAPVLPAASIPQAALAAGVAGNGPSFSAHPSAGTTLSSNTWTKINYATELWDTNSNYASSRFTPTVAGYYQINAAFGEGLSTSVMVMYMAIYKNGAPEKYMQYQTAAAWYTNIPINGMVYCNGTTDYIEIYAYTGSAYTNDTKKQTNFFEGFLARAA